MCQSLACVPLVALLAAAGAAAQGDLPQLRLPAPSANELNGPRPAEPEPILPRFNLERAAQEPDYSLYGLFQSAHGDFMGKRRRYDPLVELRGQYFPDASVSSENGKFDLLRGVFDAEVPIYVASEGYLLTGLRGEIRNYQSQNMLPFDDEDLMQLGLKFGFGWFIDNDILIEAMVEPSIFSDLDGTLHHKDFDFPGGVLVTHRLSSDFFLKYGVRYNEVYHDANTLPWLGFSYMLTPEWRFDVLLPETMEVSWWPDPAMGLQLGIEVQGAEYRVRNSMAQGEQQADVQVQEVLPYFGVMWRTSDNFSLFGRIGLSVAGDYKLTDGTAAARTLSGAMEAGVYFELGMGFGW